MTSAAKKARSSESSPAFRWSEVLAERARAAPTKGQRTDLRLRAAAAAALETTPYHTFKISDVTEGADVSYGLFYHYFTDKLQLTDEVLRGFLDESDKIYRSMHVTEDAFASIYAANLFYVDLYRLNAGLMAAAFALADESPDFRAYWADILHGWHERMAKPVSSQAGWKDEARRPLLVAYALGGMIDQLCLQLYVKSPAQLGTYAPEEVALTLTRIWHRAVYGGDPPKI